MLASHGMEIRVLGFASAGEILGGDELTFTLADDARLNDLKTALIERFPALGPVWPRLAVAIDGDLVDASDDPTLSDNQEVALLPPVSGGDGSPPHRATLVDGPLDVDAVRRQVSHARCGAVVVFTGSARDHHRGRVVTGLTYSAYRPLAERALTRIVTGLEAGDPDHRAAIAHRLGDVAAGEVSVVIATSAPHRDAAYQANREALERLKREVPIWKREHYGDGESLWREEEPLTVPS